MKILIKGHVVLHTVPTPINSRFQTFLPFISADATEVCHLETFNASCPHGSVIMMTSARYGRMRVGRCLSTSYFVGCYANVLPYADAKCSGRRSCAIRVLDPELVQFQPCRKDLMAYLEASYKCIPGKNLFLFLSLACQDSDFCRFSRNDFLTEQWHRY